MVDLASVPDIENVRWVLNSLGGEAISLPDGAEAFLSLNPKEQSISGNGGCNKLFGGMQLDGSSLSFKNLGSTKKMCEGSMAVEKGFMNALSSTKSFSMGENGMLSLLGDKGKVLAGLKKIAP